MDDSSNGDGALAGRRVAWEEASLVEGTEAVLWPASREEDAAGDPLPETSEGVAAVLSWVTPKVLRFETASPEPLPELLLVSTLAVGGPARLVVRKTYQVGNTAVYDPPTAIYLVERRELFRVVVAVPVSVWVGTKECSVHSLDCSSGGVRLYLPAPLDVGHEAVLALEIGESTPLRAVGTARHCKKLTDELWVAGFEFASLPPGGGRQLSHFLALQERRLMPRVSSLALVEYRSHGRNGFREGLANELSPGALVLGLYEAHVPGDAIEVSLRLRRRSFTFPGRVVASAAVVDDSQTPVRHKVTVCLDPQDRAAEDEFRKAVRDLALEKLASG